MARRPADHTRVYKIVDAAQWAVLQEGLPWSGAPVDLADGFVHLSAADQVDGTLQRHFTGRSGLRVLELPVASLSATALRWEVSRKGDLFPHLYAPMTLDTVVAVHPVEWAPDGTPQVAALAL